MKKCWIKFPCCPSDMARYSSFCIYLWEFVFILSYLKHVFNLIVNAKNICMLYFYKLTCSTQKYQNNMGKKNILIFFFFILSETFFLMFYFVIDYNFSWNIIYILNVHGFLIFASMYNSFNAQTLREFLTETCTLISPCRACKI